MGLIDALDGMKYDQRLLDFNLKNGIITQEEYNKYVSELSDISSEGEKLEIEEYSTQSSSSQREPAQPQQQANPYGSSQQGGGYNPGGSSY